MNGLIRGSLNNPYAMTVMALTVLVVGSLALMRISIDILPIFRSPAVQVLTFYGGMPAVGMEKSITNRMERGTGHGQRRCPARIAVDCRCQSCPQLTSSRASIPAGH